MLLAPYAAVTLALATVTMPTAANAALVQEFVEARVSTQNRVCGELLAGLAVSGAKATLAAAEGSLVPAAARSRVYETATLSVILLSQAGGLNLGDRLKAGEMTKRIELRTAEDHIEVARYCARRASDWVTDGRVDKDLVSKAAVQAKALVDNLVYNADKP